MLEGAPISSAVEVVLRAMSCSVTLPAGAGKTELIAASVARAAQKGGTCLVLTHTHAGVDALRRRMKKFGVANDQVVVRTIDSWSYDLIAHFPSLAGLDVPVVPDWSKSAEYHRAAARAAASRAVGRMLKVSYTQLFVDEYQDCLVDQHELVLALAATVPTAVFGDPLQSLFNFSDNRPVDWESDILPNFPAVEIDYRPRRWEPNHQALGEWLLEIRRSLLNGLPINLERAPVTWVPRDNPRTYVQVCYRALRLEGTIAVLGQFRPDCVNAGSSLEGAYLVMEAIDEKMTMALAETIDSEEGAALAKRVVEFAIECSSGLATHISSIKRRRLGEGRSFTTKRADLKPAYEAVLQVRSDPTPEAVGIALDLLSKLPNVTVHCREAWNEVTRSVAVAVTDGCSVSEALSRTRNHARVVGRRPTARVVSRPLLVKGLEYDHVIILNPERYSAQELYVALTRGSKSVTIISNTVVLPPAEIASRHSKIVSPHPSLF
ncbi:AAA family ATPase [Micrococcus luteus]|uniref:AAA family ATPase n=1 Tax=Micrococcus luteus TaxID=1270 RepID=A0AAP3EWN0_MICLU|nr:AAA family ATPase [Micrococcus luteus]